MKIVIYLFAYCFAFHIATAQTLVADKEHLFTAGEINRIDSMLQNYHKTSGNLIVVCTDTLDVTTKMYKDSLINLYTGNMNVKPYALFLLLSRKNSTLQLESNDIQLEPNGISKDSSEKKKMIKENLEELMKILSYGVPALKEKKREEGVTIICLKAMEFLDARPKRELNK